MNPYRFPGQVAAGPRFVGREEQLRRLQSLWSSGRPGNMCILGNHRIGKTSLVEHAQTVYSGRRTDHLFVRLNVGTFETGPDLFRALALEANQAVNQHQQPIDAALRGRLENILLAVSGAEEWFDLRLHVRAYFSMLHQAGFFLTVILDEFDRATKVLTRLADFQFLRDLASEPGTSVGLITISRRGVKAIEVDAIGGSTLDGVLGIRCEVTLFTDQDIDRMLARADAAGMDLRPSREEIVWYAGAHPYLLDLLCFEMVEDFLTTGAVDVHAAYQRLAVQYEDQFTRMVDLIIEDSGGSCGPVLDMILDGDDLAGREDQLQLLNRQGLIRRDGDRWLFFSPAFERHLRRRPRWQPTV
jgi:hypothetical protein